MPNLTRSQFINLSASFVATWVGGPTAAKADNFPTKPIRLIVPYPAGGATDVVARIVGQQMSSFLGQSVIVENRPGGSGVVGSQFVSKAQPDGYTIVFGTSASHAINAIMVKPLPYDPIEGFTPIAPIVTIPNAVIVNTSSPIQTVSDLVSYLKEHPGTSYGTSDPSSSGRFAAELLQAQLGVKMSLLPYKGGSEAVLDVVGNHIPLAVTDIGGATPLLRAGQIRVIAFTSNKRLASYPDIPTVAEAAGLADFEAEAWVAAFGPPRMPPGIVEKLNAAINAGLTTPDAKSAIEKTGCVPVGGSPSDLDRFTRSELEKWRFLAKANNIGPQ